MPKDAPTPSKVKVEKPKAQKPKSEKAKSERPKLEKDKARARRKKRLLSGEKSEWNILFFIIGEGMISSSMISQLKAITEAGFEEDTNVLVYFDPNCNGKNARIFDVNALRKEKYENRETGKKTIIGDGKDSWVRDIAEDCYIPCLPQIPAEITLRYFLEYARAYYPAKKYMVFLMGHGVIVGNDAFLPDPDDNTAITLPDLGWILRTFAEKVRGDGSEFNLVGFHSCSMSSVELLYELEGSAQYMIGTQGAAFPGSWPYRQLLKNIFNAIERSKAAKNGDKEIVGTILQGMQSLSFYNSEDFWVAGFSSDISLCNLDPVLIKELREPIEKLSRALQRGVRDVTARDLIRLAHLESQSYWDENYTDLYDFCSCLWKRCDRKNEIQNDIRRACEKVAFAINGKKLSRDDNAPPDRRKKSGKKSTNLTNKLVAYSDYYGPAYQYSNGLSIFFPWRSPATDVIEAYLEYKFTQDFGSNAWWNFLKQYFRKTQREARSTRTPWRSRPEVANLMPWRVKSDLVRTLSDPGILALGPPPARLGNDLTSVSTDLSKVGRDLYRLGGDLSKVGGRLSSENGDDELSKVGGRLGTAGRKLSNVGVTLSKVGGRLEKGAGDLSGKAGGQLAGRIGSELSTAAVTLSKLSEDLSKEEDELADKVGEDLATEVGAELTKLFGELSKVGGSLSKVGGNLSDKVGGNLSKVGGRLSDKVGGRLSKVGGQLSKVGGRLSKVAGDLSSTGGSELQKVGANLGALYGHTVIKNFASPEHQFITSRPNKEEFNLAVKESGSKASARPGSKKRPTGGRYAEGIKK
jgi:hypothetical protein